MIDITVKVQLKTFVTTIDDYTTYVFEIQDERDISLTESYYVMCVKYPNWDQDEIKIGDIGYLHFKEVIAGVDKWFDGNSFHYYNYSNWQFMKFIPIQTPIKKDILL